MTTPKTTQKPVPQTQKPLKDKVSISLDPDVVAEIQRLAEEDDRTFSSYINKVLKEHIRSFENVME